MDQFPSNSKRPPRARDEPRKVERVVTGEVVRRKTPLRRRLSQNLIGGDAQSVWGFVFGEILIPGTRDLIVDVFRDGVERMVYGDASTSRRGRSRYGGPPGHTPYNRMSSSRRDEPRRDISRRGRMMHNFDEIILETRVEAEEVLDRLEDLIERYDSAAVRDLYELVGISSNYMDEKFGWTDLRGSTLSKDRNGWRLNLPKPEPID